MEIKEIARSAYPEFLLPLLEIPEPPERLYVTGILPKKDGMKTLTVVGSRRNSSYGKEVCENLIAGLRGYPVIIVSGLALGIDSIAHKSALGVGLITVAVPGSGLAPKVLYPSFHRPLAKEITEAGGALISEFEPETQAAPWTFPKRNRIMAGLADALLVIEAEERSGTQITARLALDYNRTVLSVPGNITSETSAGTNRLIREGAVPVTSPEDILRELGFEIKEGEQRTFDFSSFSQAEQKLLELLREPRHKDELLSLSGLSAGDALSALTILEIKGVIKEELGLVRILLN